MYFQPIPKRLSRQIPDLVAALENSVVGVDVASYPNDDDEVEFGVTLRHSPVNVDQGDGRVNPRIGLRTVEYFFDARGEVIDCRRSYETREGKGDFPTITKEEWDESNRPPVDLAALGIEVPLCGCTNDRLENGETCGQEGCPNATKEEA